MDSRITRIGGHIDHYFNDFCDRVFSLPWLRTSIKLFTCERNTGQEAGRLASQFLQRPNVYCISQKENRDYGWTTGAGGTTKNQYAAALIDAFRRDGIAYSQQMACTCMPTLDGDDVSESQRLAKIQAEFEAQLMRMQMHVDLPKDAYGKIKTTMSGKLDPEGRVVAGLNDDLAMSFAMNIYIIHQMISGRIETIESSFLRRLTGG
jgi:hypothetical protein